MHRTPYLIAVLVLGALVFSKFHSQTGFTSLIRFGETWRETRLDAVKALPTVVSPGSHGYDGQFYAQIALDPTLRDPDLERALDAPAYRSRRILAPTAAFLIGLGQPWLILNAYALLNVACWLCLAWLVYREITIGNAAVRFARWFGCLFSLGALESVRQSLVDVPALLFLMLAIRAQSSPRGGRSVAWMILGHLTKETNVLGSLALSFQRPLCTRNFFWFATSMIPLGAWFLYVECRFNVPAETGIGNFAVPFWGATQQLAISAREMTSGNFDGRYSFGLLAVLGLFTQFATLAFKRFPDSPWWRVGVAYGVLLCVLGPWVWSGYWAACRAVLPLTFAFNVLLPANRAFWPLWILGNLTLLHGIWRFL